MEDLLLPLKQPPLHLLDPPLPLHVHVVGPVDHDLADLRVLEQSLHRPEADDFVRNLIHHLGECLRRQDRPLLPEDRENLLPHTEPALGAAQAIELRADRSAQQPGPHLVLDPLGIQRDRAHLRARSVPAGSFMPGAPPRDGGIALPTNMAASFRRSRPTPPERSGSSSPRSWARATRASNLILARAATPSTRSTSPAVTPDRVGLFSTTHQRSRGTSRASTAIVRLAPYSENRSRVVTITIRSASSTPALATPSSARGRCTTTTS